MNKASVLRRLPPALCLIAFFAVSCPAHAESVKLAKTGQTTSDYAGDDGDLETGVAWPSPRFTSHGNGAITDNLTGLMWGADGKCLKNNYSVGDEYGAVGWWTALDAVAALNNGDYPLCSAGYDDWRLPNVTEMYSLLRHQSPYNYTWLNGQGFSNMRMDFYWTSTTGPHTMTQAKSVALHELSISSQLKTFPLNFLIVRGTSNGVVRLAATNQKHCWRTNGTEISCVGTGQDGELREGVAWPNPRFSLLGDGTVRDNMTGLMWMRNANYAQTLGYNPDSQGDGKMNWEHALDFVAAINAGTYASPGGHTDWRMPNRLEMLSIINYDQTNNAQWLYDGWPPPGELGFQNIDVTDSFSQSRCYWTSNAIIYGWVISVYNGYGAGKDTSSGYYWVWPVRGNGVFSRLCPGLPLLLNE